MQDISVLKASCTSKMAYNYQNLKWKNMFLVFFFYFFSLSRNRKIAIPRGNFSFTAKLRVGGFYEARDDPRIHLLK